MTAPRPTPTQGAPRPEAARVLLEDLVRDAKAVFEAMSPVDQAAHRLDQKRSAIHGSVPLDSPVSRAERDAAIDKRLEYVVLAAYRDECQASRDKDETIAELRAYLKVELTSAEREESRLRGAWEQEHARVHALQARLTEVEQRAATAERRGFEAGRDAAADVAWPMDLIVAGYDLRGPDGSVRGYVPVESVIDILQERAGAIRALTPPDAPQEGETTP